jgi:two-component system phosphate regulon sensor histidine kinase PhoR
MFIQLNWVKTNMEVQQFRYSMEVDAVLEKSRQDITLRLAEISGYNTSRFEGNDLDANFVNRLWNNVRWLPEPEIATIIQKHLDEEKIKFPFSYCIMHPMRGAENSSSDYNREMLAKSRFLRTTLSGYYLYLYVETPRNYISQRSAWMFGASALFTIIIITAFALTVRTMVNQKKLAEIKSDFINNMTHEFKTPLATISLASDALSMEKVRNNPELLDYYSNIIKSENRRMNKQVEKILQAAQIDKDELKLNLQAINVNDVIMKMAETFEIQVQQKNGSLNTQLAASKPTIMADEVHFSNIIYNLMDNAVKYSSENLTVNISTANVKNYVQIKIKDNGIGMNKETQARIFEKFFRAHTGNLHNIKGFGLGLSYVKAIVEAHKGKIKVESTLGKGSTFTIEFPIASGNNA